MHFLLYFLLIVWHNAKTHLMFKRKKMRLHSGSQIVDYCDYI